MDSRAKRSGESKFTMRADDLESQWASDGVVGSVEGSSGADSIHTPYDLRPYRKTAAGLWIPEPMVPSSDERALESFQDASLNDRLKNNMPARVMQGPPLTRLGAGGSEQFETGRFAYEALAGMLGDGRLASGNVSDVSVSSSEKNEVPFSNYFTGMKSMAKNASFSSASGDPGPRVKFMSSFGGKILPRPGDGKLRYVGGETRIISVNRNISYSDLMLKLKQSYGQALLMKYQLPDEDLDALISVSSEEDLENMMEEYDRLDAGEGSSRLRVFLFSATDYDVGNLTVTVDPRNSEQSYVDAINSSVESGIRKHIDNGYAGSSQNLMGHDISGAWNTNQTPDNVSVSLLGSPVPQDTVTSMVQTVEVGMPVPPRPAIPKIPLGLTSTSPSPLVPSQLFHNKHSAIPDVALQFLPDQHGKVIGHKYAASRSDGSHQDPESGGSASSSVASQHDFQRVSDSPIRAQHDMISLGNHQDPVYWAEPWRMVETVLPKADSRGMMPGIESPAMVPRVESYGKLTQVQDQRLDITQSGPKDRRSDNHFSGILLPQVEVRATLQQHQSPLSQPAGQHPFEAYPDSYRRVDLVQQPVSGAGQAWQQVLQQQQVSHAYAPALRHEAALYKQMEQSQQQGDIRNGHMAHKPLAAQMGGTQSLVGIASGPNFQIGSAPSSPRMEFQDNTGKPLRAPQLLQVNQVHIGDFADQQYGWMLHQQNEQLSRAFLSSDSSPGYFERVSPTEDRFTYQQTMVPFVDSENVPEDQGAPASLQGHQAREGHLEDQGNLLNQNVNANLVFQKQQLQPRYPINPFYKGMEAEEDWVQQQSKKGSDDARVGTEGWSHVVNMNLKEEEVNADSVARSHAQAVGSGNFQAVKVLEGLNPFLVPVVDSSRATPQLKNEQQDLLENSAFNIRAALLPPVTGLHSQAVGKTVPSDTFQAVHLAARSETSQTASRAGNKMEDSKSISSYAEVPFGTRGSNTNTDLAAAHRLLDDRISGNVSTQKAPPVTYFMPSSGFSTPEPVITAGMAEGHWNGHFGLDSMGLELVGHAPGQSVHFHVDATDGKSGLTLNNEPSRSAIGGNASVVEVASNAISSVELGPTSCKSLIDDDAIVPPYAMHMQTSDTATVSSYPMAVATLAAGLGSFTLNKASSLESSNSVAGSTTSSPVAEKSAPLSSSVPPIMGTSPFCGPTSITVDFLAEEIKGREEITAADIAGLMSASSDISFCSPGKLDGKGLFSVFDSVSIKEQTAQEKSQVNTFMRHYSHGHEDDDSKGELKHVAEDVAEAVLEPNLDSSPTLSIQNWENPLAEADLEPHSKENFLEERSLDEEKLRKEVTFEDIIVVEEAEDDGPKMNKSSKLAAIAEADAIASGLQVIKNADLEELRELGSGTFGTVYHGKWRGTDVAIKRIKPSCFGGRPSEQERLRADFWSEAHILGLLHHPNVVAFYGVVRDGPGGALATVTEYMVNGSLKQVLQKKDRTIDRRKRLVVAMDAAFGMEYLHEKNIVHFDLKCENLLVNMRDPQRPICKVADLGLSKVKKQTMVSGGVRGTLPWMAPELLNGSSSLVSEKVDVFSFGIVMWEILTGEEPYANMHYGAIIGGIVNNTLRPPIPSWSDSAWKSLMERCWSADPLERPSFSQIAAELRAMASSLSGRGQAQAHVKMQ